jgi:hypothetical protein
MWLRDPHLRPAILGALMAIHSRCPLSDAAESLLPALRASVENGVAPLCRYQAVRVLGFWTAREEVCAFLISCLSDPERLVRLAAAESLRPIKRPKLQMLLAARALEETDEEVLQALCC